MTCHHLNKISVLNTQLFRFFCVLLTLSSTFLLSTSSLNYLVEVKRIKVLVLTVYIICRCI